MNIIFFVSTLQSGGIENYLLRFLKLYHMKFGEVIIYCKSGKGGVLEKQYLEITNITIVKTEVNYKKPQSFLYLKSWLKKRNDYIVCDFTGNFAGPVMWAAKKAGVQNRTTFYRRSTNAFQKDSFRKLYNTWINNLVYKYATTILSNSKTALNFFHNGKWENDRRFDIIYNGIDVDSFTNETKNLRKSFNIPEKAFVVGHTGRYNYAKNHGTILKVAEKLIKKYDDIYFISCGEGVVTYLNPILQEKGLSNRFLAFENRSDIPKFLNTMDCFFFPSITEGQPNALIEAMISGLPVVSSNIEPIKETLPDESYIYLKDPMDSNGFIKTIENIYDSEDFKNKLIYKVWAKNHFKHKKRFKEFYNKLNLVKYK